MSLFGGLWNLPEHTKQYQLKKYADATLGSGNLRAAVVLPDGEDLNEWLAVNTLDFYNQINMLYGTITEFCTPTECPVMSAGSRYEYHWHDGKQFKKATKVCAPEYVEYLMTWVQDFLDDEKVFPCKIGETCVPSLEDLMLVKAVDLWFDVPYCLEGQEFPKTFKVTVQSIVRRLFRVYAHLYNHHFAQICALGIEAHLNTSYRHFYFFIDEFDLVKKEELVPLAELNASIAEESTP